MQSFARKEIRWASDAISDVAGHLEHVAGTAESQAERGLSALRSEQFRSIAERLAKAAADGDKRIAIR